MLAFWRPRIKSHLLPSSGTSSLFYKSFSACVKPFLFLFFLRAKKLFKSGFDLHFKLKSEISAFDRDVGVLRLNIPRDGYMTSLPQIPNMSPAGAAASTQVLRLRHQKTSYFLLPTSYFLLPAYLNRFIILFPVSYLWAVLLLSYWGGGGGCVCFFFRSFFFFNTFFPCFFGPPK